MAGSVYLQPNSIATLMDDSAAGAGDTTLTGFAHGKAVLSAAVDNTTRLDFWADLELTAYFATLALPTARLCIGFYLLRALDGTNYADGTAGASPILLQHNFIGSASVRHVSTVQILTLRRIQIPPCSFVIQLYNDTDGDFDVQNTGSRLKIVTYRAQQT